MVKQTAQERQSIPGDEKDFDGGVYPREVEEMGDRGKELYDACLREIMTSENPPSFEVAEFIVQNDWPDLIKMLAPEAKG